MAAIGCELIWTRDSSGTTAGSGEVAAYDVARGPVLVLGPDGVAGVTAATALEPGYIALSADGRTAYVTLQGNNAIAVMDLDTSDRDGGTDIAPAPVRGLYMPDGIATFGSGGRTCLVTANEGDASERGGHGDVARLKNADLAALGGADAVTALKADAALGRLNIPAVDGDTNGDIDVIHSFGARSFPIREVTETGLVQTFDSGDMIERMLLANAPSLLDDGRSDDKGPEPESVTMGTIDGRLHALLALERSASVMAFAIDSPTSATDAGIVATDDAPEVIRFVPAGDVPGGAAAVRIGSLLGSPALAASDIWGRVMRRPRRRAPGRRDGWRAGA